MRNSPLFTVSVPILLLTACENPIKRAVRDTQYSAYEMVGVQKRDLLKRRIAQTREDQKETAETFKDALENLRSLYGMSGGELERQYRRVKSSYERSKDKADELRGSHDKMETVAHDLFREWESEIKEIQTPEMKAASRTKLNQSKSKFDSLNHELMASESKMQPVLASLKDHVLYLKHNLNAESLTSLKGERDRIQGEIGTLVRDMNKSIKESDDYLKSLE